MAGLAEILGQKSDWEAAVELYQKILKLNSNSADAYAQLGIAWQEIGDLEQEIAQFEKAISINHRHIKAFMLIWV